MPCWPAVSSSSLTLLLPKLPPHHLWSRHRGTTRYSTMARSALMPAIRMPHTAKTTRDGPSGRSHPLHHHRVGTRFTSSCRQRSCTQVTGGLRQNSCQCVAMVGNHHQTGGIGRSTTSLTLQPTLWQVVFGTTAAGGHYRSLAAIVRQLTTGTRLAAPFFRYAVSTLPCWASAQLPCADKLLRGRRRLGSFGSRGCISICWPMGLLFW